MGSAFLSDFNVDSNLHHLVDRKARTHNTLCNTKRHFNLLDRQEIQSQFYQNDRKREN